MKKIFVVVILVAVIVIGGAVWWNIGQAPVNPKDTAKKTFVITPQENVRDIAYQLHQEGLIQNPTIFFLMVKELGIAGKIQAGNFQLSPAMSTKEIAETLTHGITDIWVTIPEGDRATEVAQIMANKLHNYLPSWTNILVQHEGYLFPDTYLIPANANIENILSIINRNFITKYQQAEENPTIQLSQANAVILASIVQREAVTSGDMKLVASVLENRLNIGMPLGSDVTLEYALGYQPAEKSWWKKDLTVDDLQLDSLYNTRTHAGLPPTPISNPGLEALTAVFHPTPSNYLYYLSDKNGKMHFAKTLEEHNANIAKYGVL